MEKWVFLKANNRVKGKKGGGMQTKTSDRNAMSTCEWNFWLIDENRKPMEKFNSIVSGLLHSRSVRAQKVKLKKLQHYIIVRLLVSLNTHFYIAMLS